MESPETVTNPLDVPSSPSYTSLQYVRGRQNNDAKRTLAENYEECPASVKLYAPVQYERVQAQKPITTSPWGEATAAAVPTPARAADEQEVDLKLSQMLDGTMLAPVAEDRAPLSALVGTGAGGMDLGAATDASFSGPTATEPLNGVSASSLSRWMPVQWQAHLQQHMGGYLSASQDVTSGLNTSGQLANAVANFATPPPASVSTSSVGSSDHQPLIIPRHAPPHPMLGALAGAQEGSSELLLMEDEEDSLSGMAGPHRPGYATPMRTSVVELMSYMRAEGDGDSDTSSSYDSLASTPELPHVLLHQTSAGVGGAYGVNPILEYRNQLQQAQLAHGATKPVQQARYTTASTGEIAPGSAPSKLSHKPRLIKGRSAIDGVGTSPVPAPREPIAFQWLKPSAEHPWDSIMFDSGAPLGDGNEGNVLLARFHSVPVAVKVGHHERIIKEQKLMSKLHHAHVLRTLGHSKRVEAVTHNYIMATGDTTPQKSFAAIYEYCANKDLMTYLSVSQARTDVVRMTSIFDGILSGLEYIHEAHPSVNTRGPIVHGDVKPENIMIDHDGNAKLGDFGLAQYQSTNMDVQGTPSYIAPEIVLDFLASSPHPKFTTKADIFSFGVLMVVALTGHYPFKRLTAKLHSGQMNVAQVIKHFTPSRRTLKTINDISPRFKRMVDACLCRYPEMRPSASQLRTLLFRRSKSTGEDGAPSMAALASAASSITQQHMDAIAGSDAVCPQASTTTKVPPLANHAGPFPHHMPISSGKAEGNSFDH